MLNDIYGHEVIKKKLCELKNNLPLLTIFNGPSYIGKGHTAINYIDEIYNGKIIHRINSHPDIKIFQPSTKTFKIEYIHQIQEDLMEKPFELDKKYYILKNTEFMNKHSANACLKMFEETPHFNHFFILVTDISLLPSTISSRGITFNFYPIPNLKRFFPNLTEQQERLLCGCPGLLDKVTSPITQLLLDKVHFLLDNFKSLSYAQLLLWFKEIEDLEEVDFSFLIDILQLVLLENRKKGKDFNLFPILMKKIELFKEKLNLTLNLKIHFKNILIDSKYILSEG